MYASITLAKRTQGQRECPYFFEFLCALKNAGLIGLILKEENFILVQHRRFGE
jgi:hypothetical protein